MVKIMYGPHGSKIVFGRKLTKAEKKRIKKARTAQNVAKQKEGSNAESLRDPGRHT